MSSRRSSGRRQSQPLLRQVSRPGGREHRSGADRARAGAGARCAWAKFRPAGRCPACRRRASRRAASSCRRSGRRCGSSSSRAIRIIRSGPGGFWGLVADVPIFATAPPAIPPGQNIVLQTTGQNMIMVSDAPPTPVTGGIVLKSASGAMIVVNDTGIYISNGQGATITLIGPTVTSMIDGAHRNRVRSVCDGTRSTRRYSDARTNSAYGSDVVTVLARRPGDADGAQPGGAGFRHADRDHRRAVCGRGMRFCAARRQRALRHRAVDCGRDASASQGQPVAIMTGVSICVPTGTPMLPVAAQTRGVGDIANAIVSTMNVNFPYQFDGRGRTADAMQRLRPPAGGAGAVHLARRARQPARLRQRPAATALRAQQPGDGRGHAVHRAGARCRSGSATTSRCSRWSRRSDEAALTVTVTYSPLNTDVTQVQTFVYGGHLVIYTCCNENRKAAVLGNPTLNGIDYLEVLDCDAQPLGLAPADDLLVHCLKAAPTGSDAGQRPHRPAARASPVLSRPVDRARDHSAGARATAGAAELLYARCRMPPTC